MNILVTNDDGIASMGIVRLAEAAKKFGNVCVVAPDHQCSAMSHKVTLGVPIDVYEVKDFPVEGVRAFKASGTPADCVRVGRLNLVEGETDLVLSGINEGGNTGADIQYSGTAAAAFEASTNCIPAIAVSEDCTEIHEVLDRYLQELLAELIAKPLPQNQIWNINFPGCPLAECKGVLRDRKASPNKMFIDSFHEDPLPDGGRRFSIRGDFKPNPPAGSDIEALWNRYISIGVVSNVQ